MNLLSPLGWIYGRIADARNRLYDRGTFDAVSLGARTISVGNITVGGTGKTPLVALIAETLADKGESVCILTRGYGRKNAGASVIVSDGKEVRADALAGGDEPVELAHRLAGKAAVIADRDRVAAAERALAEFQSTVFVLDDAFQHRRVLRDLDIVCVDASDPFGNRKVLPAGKLREPLSGLGRADAIVITRQDQAADLTQLISDVKTLSPSAQIFTARNRIVAISELSEFSGNGNTSPSVKRTATPHGQVKYFAICGIGNPASFFRQLELEGLLLAGTKAFPDHFYFSERDIRALERSAREADSDRLITTAKDAVRLAGLSFSIDCDVVVMDVEVTPLEEFLSLISS